MVTLRLIQQSESKPRMQTGDINSLLEYHHKDCYGWALHCCSHDRLLANEVLQASYLKVLEKHNTFAEKAIFKTWIFKIIKNTAIDALRKTKREKRLIQHETDLPEGSYDARFENLLKKKFSAAFFTEALEQLSIRQRQVMQLVFYHDFSLNQAAEVLNISQGSVRKHYDRAKKILTAWFQQKGIITLSTFDGLI